MIEVLQPLLTRCGFDVDEVGTFEAALALLRYNDLIGTVGTFIVGMLVHEIYLLAFSTLMAAAVIVGGLLRLAIASPTPLGPACGGYTYGSPSAMSLYVTFVTASIAIFTYQFRAPYANCVYQHTVLAAWWTATLYADVRFRFSTPLQSVVGTAVGVGLAAVAQLIVVGAVLAPRFDALLTYWPLSSFGYANTWCDDGDDVDDTSSTLSSEKTPLPSTKR
jgi:hypothetical protein